MAMTLFSKRNLKLPDVFTTDIVPDTLRTQILWILKEQYKNDDRSFALVRDHVCKERGLSSLTDQAHPSRDVFSCIAHSRDTTLILDCVQLLLAILGNGYGPYGSDAELAIAEFNRYCLEAGFGYEFNREKRMLIPIDNSLLHQEAVRPALGLLSKAGFSTANNEYLAGFEHFKRGEYGDCLTECCKAIEGTVKIIGQKKGWTIAPMATMRPLLRTYIQQTGIDSFWEHAIMPLATLRNRMDAHGAGATPHVVPKHVAQYALHAAGSAIVFLVEGAGL